MSASSGKRARNKAKVRIVAEATEGEAGAQTSGEYVVMMNVKHEQQQGWWQLRIRHLPLQSSSSTTSNSSPTCSK